VDTKQVSPLKQIKDDAMDQIINEIDQQQTTHQKRFKGKPVIVIDAQNVAMRQGKGEVFATLGIQIAINFWLKNGHPVKAFLPEYLLDIEQVNKKKQQNKFQTGTVRASQMPDNVMYLVQLEKQGYIVATPS